MCACTSKRSNSSAYFIRSPQDQPRTAFDPHNRAGTYRVFCGTCFGRTLSRGGTLDRVSILHIPAVPLTKLLSTLNTTMQSQPYFDEQSQAHLSDQVGYTSIIRRFIRTLSFAWWTRQSKLGFPFPPLAKVNGYDNIIRCRHELDSDPPPSLAKDTFAPSFPSATVRGRWRMDDVKDLLTLDKCRVGGGRSQISTTLFFGTHPIDESAPLDYYNFLCGRIGKG